MQDFNREEIGSTLLGFLGFFGAMGFLALGMLPVWLVLLPLAVVTGLVIGTVALVGQIIRPR